MSKIAQNLMHESLARQASAKLKCIDAISCIERFTSDYEKWLTNPPDEKKLIEITQKFYNMCVEYGLTNL